MDPKEPSADCRVVAPPFLNRPQTGQALNQSAIPRGLLRINLILTRYANPPITAIAAGMTIHQGRGGRTNIIATATKVLKVRIKRRGTTIMANAISTTFNVKEAFDIVQPFALPRTY